MVMKMKKEMKSQLVLSLALIVITLMTLFFWYHNFIFHTYVDTSTQQYCFSGKNDDFMIEGYQIYQKNHQQIAGQARVICTNDQFFLSHDNVELVLTYENNQGKTSFTHQFQIQNSHEVIHLDQQMNDQILQKPQNVDVEITIQRDNQVVYQNHMSLDNQLLALYSGGNKDYLIQNVYVSSSWLKTGDFSTKAKDLSQQYPYMSIDYLYLKEQGKNNDINDYERFAYLKGKTDDFIQQQITTTVFYDEDGSLLDKPLCCVITLSKEENDQDPYTFVLELHHTINVGDSYE